VATRFSELDYRMIPTDKCTVPAGFNEVLTRIIGTPTKTYTGRVVDTSAMPVPFAFVYFWDTNWQIFSTFAKADGSFLLPLDRTLVRIGATHFGYENAAKWVGTSLNLGDFVLQKVPKWLTPTEDLHTPSTRRAVCWDGEQWNPWQK